MSKNKKGKNMTTNNDNKTSVQQRQHDVNEIVTSSKTTGEILAELQKIIPQFDYEEAE